MMNLNQSQSKFSFDEFFKYLVSAGFRAYRYKHQGNMLSVWCKPEYKPAAGAWPVESYKYEVGGVITETPFGKPRQYAPTDGIEVDTQATIQHIIDVLRRNGWFVEGDGVPEPFDMDRAAAENALLIRELPANERKTEVVVITASKVLPLPVNEFV